MAYSLFFLMVHYRTVQKPLSIVFVFSGKYSTMKKKGTWPTMTGGFESWRAFFLIRPLAIVLLYSNSHAYNIQSKQFGSVVHVLIGNLNDLGSILGLPPFHLFFLN